MSIISLILFRSRKRYVYFDVTTDIPFFFTFQVYTRLNQVGVAVSYDTTLSTISKIAKLHQVPIKDWLSTGTDIKFVGDNVDKNVRVRDIRSDHRWYTCTVCLWSKAEFFFQQRVERVISRTAQHCIFYHPNTIWMKFKYIKASIVISRQTHYTPIFH